MHYLEGLSIVDYHRQLKRVPDAKTAWKIIREFYDFFEAQGAEEMLWYMLTLALISDDEEIERKHRSNMIFFYEYCRAFHQAVHLIYEEKSAAKKEKGKKRKEKSS